MAASRKTDSRSRASRGGAPGSRRGGAPSRHRGLGILFWICLAAVVVAVAVAAREPIKAAFTQVQKKQGPATAAPSSPVGSPAASAQGAPSHPAASAAGAAGDAPRVSVAPLSSTERGANAGTAAAAGTAAPAASDRVASVPRPIARKARLFFTVVDPAGALELKSVIRSIPASDSPLHDTLESLLKGPTAQEMNLGLVSMIPTDARLRSVAVKDDTAIIDFSEGFRFNSQGLDAMNAQLRQVVYAATEFPTVRRVQIRIEGQTVRYLGTEGMRLDQPLTRDSFGKQS
ncbi:MAG TPA: GerMN domain-containing protein [Spirochaetia bacterium]|nr:GerMN domain-containing protein [Spirochaetia bacterium]